MINALQRCMKNNSGQYEWAKFSGLPIEKKKSQWTAAGLKLDGL